MRFIRLRLGSYVVMHGYDAENREIEERVEQPAFADKLVAVDRILSATERFVLTTYADGRLIYWEYEGGLEALAARLERAGLLAPAPAA